jgi:hypothetical protein
MAIIAAAGIGAAASIFGSSSSSSAAKAQAQAQKEAAELQTRVARELHEHWKAYYRDCDIAYIREVCAIPVYVPQYETVQSRTRMEVLGSFGRARQQMLRACDIFCVGKVAQDCNFIAGIEAIALADAMNFGYRREENLKIQLDQMRLDNQRAALALGRNLLDQSRAASTVAAGVGARVGAQAGNAANGWLQFAGFLNTPEGKRLLGDVGKGVSNIFSSPQGAQPGFDPGPGAGTGGDFDSSNYEQMNNPGDTQQSNFESSQSLYPGPNFADPAQAAAAAGA